MMPMAWSWTRSGTKRPVDDRQAGQLAEASHSVAIELDIVDQGVDPLGDGAAREHDRSSSRQGQLDAKPSRMTVVFAAPIAEVPLRLGSAMKTSLQPISSRRRLCDQVQQSGKVGLARDRDANLRHRLELSQPAPRRLVEARVLDRDGGLCCKELTSSSSSSVKSWPPSFSVR